MSSEENKKMVEYIFSELSKGNDKPLINAMANEIQWRWMGTGNLSRTFKGKSSVLNELWNSVKTSIAQPYKVFPHRFIADGDYVVIEHTGLGGGVMGDMGKPLPASRFAVLPATSHTAVITQVDLLLGFIEPFLKGETPKGFFEPQETK